MYINADLLTNITTYIKTRYPLSSLIEAMNWVLSQLEIPTEEDGDSYVVRTNHESLLGDIINMSNSNLIPPRKIDINIYFSNFIDYLTNHDMYIEGRAGSEYPWLKASSAVEEFITKDLPSFIVDDQVPLNVRIFGYAVFFSVYVSGSNELAALNYTDIEKIMEHQRPLEPLRLLKPHIKAEKIMMDLRNLPEYELEKMMDAGGAVASGLSRQDLEGKNHNSAKEFMKKKKKTFKIEKSFSNNELSAESYRMKATWIGEGEPPSGIYEYGAGTENPTIPLGVLKERKNGDSNWQFEYVNDTSATQIEEYLNLPVYFYTDNHNQIRYTPNREDVPQEYDAKEGCIADVYKLFNAKEAQAPGKKPIKGRYPQHEGILSQMNAVRVSITPKFDSFIVRLDDKKGDIPLSKVYMIAALMKNTKLMQQIEAFTGSGKKTLEVTAQEMFPEATSRFFGVMGGVSNIMGQIIQKAKDQKDMKRMLVQHVYGKYYENITPQESGREQRVAEKEKVKDTNAPKPINNQDAQTVSTPADTGLPASDDAFDVNLHVGGVFAGLPHELVQKAVDSLSADQKTIARQIFPGIINKDGVVGDYGLKNMNPIGKGGPSVPLDKVIDVIASLQSGLANADFYMGSKASSIFMRGFPSDVPHRKPQIARGIQAGFRIALINAAKGYDQNANDPRDSKRVAQFLQSDMRSFADLPDSLIKQAVDTMHLSPDLMKELAGSTAGTHEDLTSAIKLQIMRNYKVSKSIQKTEGFKNFELKGGKGLVDGGSVLGLLKGVVNEGLAADKNAPRNMDKISDDFEKVMTAMVGSIPGAYRVANNYIVLPSENGDDPLVLNVGELSYMAPFLDFEIDNDGDIMVCDEDGDLVYLDSLRDVDVTHKLRTWMAYTHRLDSDAAITNVVRNFMNANNKLYGGESESILGSNRNVKVMDRQEDIYSDEKAMFKYVDATSSALSYITSRISDVVRVDNKGIIYTGRATTTDLLNLHSQVRASVDMDAVCSAYGIEQNRETFWNAYLYTVDSCFTNLIKAYEDAEHSINPVPNKKLGSMGQYFEEMGMLPALANICNKSESVKITRYGTLITPMPQSKLRNKYLTSKNDANGFELQVDGKTEVLAKEKRPSGAVDSYHRAGNKFYPLEVKITYDSIDRPHMSLASDFARHLLQNTKHDGDLEISRVKHLNMTYGLSGDKPTGMFSNMGRNKNSYFGNATYSLARQFDRKGYMNQDILENYFSVNDGTGLVGTS